ncbi:MAG: PQQ-dependent sugar dehydrogenase [Planctomycetes bacterium]|nr:PQQ-dependent sugar dehydrogenase [Planctomycetota bacterium]MCB9935922.1 PQQ-dependent sugar dehydrogenase [Planctomycetota bacterium]
MKILLSILCLVLLAGCGGGDDGGGGSGGGTPGIPDPGPRDPLPSAWVDLDYYFDVELIQNGLNTPCKMDQAPDGRLFVSLLDGQIITVETTAPYTITNWASVTVLNGPEQGLLGIAVSPNFATDHYVYVVACVNNGTDVQQVIRYEEVAGVGANPTVILDNLPTANVHNSGALEFLNDGTLVLTVGDATVPADSQANGTNAGRVLRFNVNGTPAAGNPFGGSDAYEWCRGLRNTYGMCVHPATGTLIGVENGPNNNDELNYLVAGKNYEWGNTGTIPGAQIGVRIRNWPTVIVPTGVSYHSGNSFPTGYASNLFICSYDEARIYRFVMDGSPPVNISSEHVFGEMTNIGTTNKPLDILEAADGSLYVSTFTAIWRIWRRTGP